MVLSIPPTPNVCPQCHKPAVQKWWCLYCGEFYSNKHSTIYSECASTEIKNIEKLLVCLSSFKDDFIDSWPDDLTNKMLTSTDISTDDGEIVISGFTVHALIEAIKLALTKDS